MEISIPVSLIFLMICTSELAWANVADLVFESEGSQSSTTEEMSFEGAVDGEQDTCAKTQVEVMPWFMFNLRTVNRINSVEISAKLDPDSVDGITILKMRGHISPPNISEHHTCGMTASGVNKTIVCEILKGEEGHDFIAVIGPEEGATQLEICDLKVFGEEISLSNSVDDPARHVPDDLIKKNSTAESPGSDGPTRDGPELFTIVSDAPGSDAPGSDAPGYDAPAGVSPMTTEQQISRSAGLAVLKPVLIASSVAAVVLRALIA